MKLSAFVLYSIVVFVSPFAQAGGSDIEIDMNEVYKAMGAPAAAAIPKIKLQSKQQRQSKPKRKTPAPSRCDSGHWIQAVVGDGTIIKLEDDSVWLIDDISAIDAALWLPTSDVVVCGNTLINIDENEAVPATRIR